MFNNPLNPGAFVAPTPAPGNNNSLIATTAFVKAAGVNPVNIAAPMNPDPGFNVTINVGNYPNQTLFNSFCPTNGRTLTIVLDDNLVDGYTYYIWVSTAAVILQAGSSFGVDGMNGAVNFGANATFACPASVLITIVKGGGFWAIDFAQGPVKAWTPTISLTSASGAFNALTIFNSIYIDLGFFTIFTVSFQVTITTANTGVNFLVTLPNTITGSIAGAGRENQVNGNSVNIWADGNTAFGITYYNGSGSCSASATATTTGQIIYTILGAYQSSP